MNKEEILALCKELVVFVRDHSTDLLMIKKKRDWFQEKVELLEKEISSLSPEDKAWADKEYKAWHKKVIQNIS
jgi:hypothetical protein